ncbi:ABC transporter transmembrane domain-containing protein [Oceanomicrobium pacificus]|uniref:ATP-binding cassette domain-containing protein n=1 Tax=Oceanomicrobium pacificus TaxID=2692916 RepID=A0A6B0TPG1_9RHOB|nr:ABC transporter transmembrane domain-containing protein [Oceanomicrobium pacificus]MXU66530.1 ATP-binding cassette domain-containing protein [Oceanomicrobium pacificus]
MAQVDTAPTQPASEEKPEDREASKSVSPLRGLLPFFRPYRHLVLGAVFALFFTAAMSLILPLTVRIVIDGLNEKGLAEIDEYFVGALIIMGLLALGTGLRFYIVTRLGERVVADIRMAVYNKVIGMSPAFYEKILTGEVLSRLTTDTTLILSVVGSSISVALRNTLLFLGGILFMTVTSAKLAGMVLLLVPVVLLPILGLGRKLRRLSRINQDAIAASSGEASETLLAAQTVQAYSHEDASRGHFDALTETAFNAARRRIYIRSLLTVVVIFLIFTGICTVLWMGARDVRAGNMSVGELVQFLIYSVMVAGAVAALSEIWGELQRAAGATERLIELIEAEDVIKDPEHPVPAPDPAKGELAFRDVTFRYPARPDVAALDNLSLRIAPGETVALVGPSGAGKSTIFQLLMRFFDPSAGDITLDGIPLHHMLRDEMRRSFALVPQDPVIFASPAIDNIRFGRPEASDAEVIAAAKAAAAHDFLTALPQGYDTYVGERGVMLSGGQKQRIAIARAILRDAPVLLLDEATSALDAASELAVQKAVEKLSKDRTTLVIAHRLATVKKADRIIVFDQGRIVAEGTHNDLVRQGGLYAELARLQFTDGELPEADLENA